MNPLITPDEASDIIAQHSSLLTPERLPLSEARGLILAESILADRPFPPFSRAMMDGIACRRSDATNYRTLTLQGLHAAGSPPPPALRPEHAWEIMTGAALPADCDMIIPYEELEIDSGKATLPESLPDLGQFIHAIGSDAEKGAVLLSSSNRLTAPALTLAASAGYCSVLVHPKPRVAIVSTGDELVEISETPQDWEIRRTNPLALEAVLRGIGINHITVMASPDDLESTIQTLSEASSKHDAVLISGGISKGKKDFIRPALEELFGAPHFHGVAQRPGKPLAFWKSANSPLIFALPGNPTSSLAACLRYVRPCLQQIIGLPDNSRFVSLSQDVQAHPKLTTFLPCLVDANSCATIIRSQNSGDELTPAMATGLIEVPPTDMALPAGSSLPYLSYL